MNTQLAFTLEDLKPGMVVEYRNEERRLVLKTNKGLSLTGYTGYRSQLDLYDSNFGNLGCSQMDIIRVYNIKNPCILQNIFKNENLELLWENPSSNIIEVSLQDIADLLKVSVEQIRIKE